MLWHRAKIFTDGFMSKAKRKYAPLNSARAFKRSDPSEQFPYVKPVKNARAKRLTLRLDYRERLFVLTLPRYCSAAKAVSFLQANDEWMQDKLRELPERVAFEHGTVLSLFGERTKIQIEYDESFTRTDCFLEDGLLAVRTNQEDPSMRITRYLKRIAKERLSALTQDKADMIDQAVQSVSIRDTKSRWGSCSADGHISLSWRLIFAPYEAMDYVVAHEAAHLVHMDHSKAFWALCRELSDDYVEGHHWIQSNGHSLMRFG